MINVWEQLTILKDKGGWLFRRNLEERLHALSKIVDNGDWKVICTLFPFLRDGSIEVRLATVDAITQLFDREIPKNHYYESLKYCDISKADIDRFRSVFDKDQYLILLKIASLNLNGFVRERAVSELGLSNDDAAIPFILHRLGDWVAQVRFASEAAIGRFKSPSHIDGLIKNLPGIEALQRIKRVDLTPIYESLMHFVITENRSHVRDNFRSYPEKVRGILARHLSTSKMTEQDLQMFCGDPSPHIRILAVDHFEILSPEDIAKLLRDKYFKVRLHTLYKLKPRVDFDDVVRPYLADDSASIRQFARYSLRSEKNNFGEYYEDNLKSGRAIAASLSSLGEIGGKEFAEAIDPYLDSPAIKVRKAAMLALMKLDKPRASKLALVRLDDELKGIRKISAKFLEKIQSPEVLARAREIFNSGSLELRTEILTMLSRIGGWVAVPDILLATVDKNESIRRLAVKYLDSWKFKSATLFTRPTADELSYFREVIKAVYHEHKRINYFETNPASGFDFYLK